MIHCVSCLSGGKTKQSQKLEHTVVVPKWTPTQDPMLAQTRRFIDICKSTRSHSYARRHPYHLPPTLQCVTDIIFQCNPPYIPMKSWTPDRLLPLPKIIRTSLLPANTIISSWIRRRSRATMNHTTACCAILLTSQRWRFAQQIKIPCHVASLWLTSSKHAHCIGIRLIEHAFENIKTTHITTGIIYKTVPCVKQDVRRPNKTRTVTKPWRCGIV